MSDMKGNPHVYEGPQIAPPETINDHYISEAGLTDETVLLSELARNTEATLALAYEQRTANLLKWIELVDRARPEGVYPTEVDVELQAQVVKRLGLNGKTMSETSKIILDIKAPEPVTITVEYPENEGMSAIRALMKLGKQGPDLAKALAREGDESIQASLMEAGLVLTDDEDD